MKKFILALSLITASLIADAYQVTGKVVEVTDSKIVVMKGKEKFEIALDSATSEMAKAKVGDKVKVEYTMTATSVEMKK